MGVDLLKGVTVDDPSFIRLARQIAEEPGDPYGFRWFWGNQEVDAVHSFIPPGLPYGLAVGMALGADDPITWKVWLATYALVLVLALRSLARRLAPATAAVAFWMVIASPLVMPSLNIMPDLPSLALGCGGMALFLRSWDSPSWRLALAAGVLFGVGMQTKYTVVVPLTAVVCHAALSRRWSLALVTGAAASAVFVGFEAWTHLTYGTSSLLGAWSLFGGVAGGDHLAVIRRIALPCLVGALATPVGLLGLLALGCSRRSLVLAGAVIPALLVGVLMAPPADTPVIDFAAVADVEVTLRWAFGLAGAGVLLVLARVGLRSLSTARDLATRLDARLLVLWVALEVLLYFKLAPFPAARRILGLAVAMTLLAAHLLSRSSPEQRPASVMRGILAASAGLALVFTASDVLDSRARERLALEVEGSLVDLGVDRSRETIWYGGHWGLQYHAEEFGWAQLEAGRSRLEVGDWIVHVTGLNAQWLPPIRASAARATLEVTSPVPWSTTPSAYAGVLPLVRQPRAQLVATIHRVEEEQVLALPPGQGR